MSNLLRVYEKKDLPKSNFNIDGLDIYTCRSCGHEYLSEFFGDGLLFYCASCDPVAYKENGEPYLIRVEQEILTTHASEGGKI